MALCVEVRRRNATVSLDLSQEGSHKQIIQALQEDGWVVLKKATDLNSTEEAKFNKVWPGTQLHASF